MFGKGLHRGCLFGFVSYDFGLTQDNDRAVVYRVMKSRACQHETVNVRHRHANIYPACQSPKHPACRGAVDQKPVAYSRKSGRHHKWLNVEHKSDMTNECGVEDCIDRLA